MRKFLRIFLSQSIQNVFYIIPYSLLFGWVNNNSHWFTKIPMFRAANRKRKVLRRKSTLFFPAVLGFLILCSDSLRPGPGSPLGGRTVKQITRGWVRGHIIVIIDYSVLPYRVILWLTWPLTHISDCSLVICFTII